MKIPLFKWTTSTLGRILYAPFRAALHFARALLYPHITADREVTRATYLHHTFSIVHRRWNESDPAAIRQCFDFAQYDMPTGAHGELVARVYREIVDSGRKPLIVDCGANIGASALWFSARYPEAHILAVEPAPDNFALLQINCADIDADLRRVGIGATDGSARLRDPFGSGGMSYRTAEDPHGEDTPDGIHIASLATLLASKPSDRFAPFLLKVDIEGAEASLFAGDHEVLNRFPLIILEPHDWMLPGTHSSVEFFRFHSEAGREFSMKEENVASIICDPSLLNYTGKLIPSGHV